MSKKTIFISHISSETELAQSLKKHLEKDFLEFVSIFVSSDSETIQAGSKWLDEIDKALRKADLQIVLCSKESVEKPWVNFEAGAVWTQEKTVIPLCHAGLTPKELPFPLRSLQAIDCSNPEDIKKLYNRIATELKTDLPNVNFDKLADELNKIDEQYLVYKKSLSLRLWINITKDQIQEVQSGKLPKNVRFEGEPGALKKFGISDDGASVENLESDKELEKTYELYLPHVAHALSTIITKKEDIWNIPPVKVTKDGRANVLIPTLYEERFNEYYFEFFVHQPRANFKLNEETAFTALFNLFVVSWYFRWNILDQWVERLNTLKSRGPDANDEEIKNKLDEFHLRFNEIILDGLNRGLDAPRKVEKHFDVKKDRAILEKILDQKKGLWAQYHGKLNSALSKYDLNLTIDNLLKIRDINKTVILLTLKRLEEIALMQEGKILEIETKIKAKKLTKRQ
jgi:hypothetical protein